MKIVGVSACPTGIAHTYMAQEAIEKEARKRGWECKVETQGGMGIENELSQEEIDEADVVLFAVAIEVEDSDRFEEKEEKGKILTAEPGEVIKNTEIIFDQLEQL